MLNSKCPEPEDFKGSYTQMRKGFGPGVLLITSIASSGFSGFVLPSRNPVSSRTDTHGTAGSGTQHTHHARITHGSRACRAKAESTLQTRTHTGVKGLILLILLLPQTVLTHSCSKATHTSKAATHGHLHRHLYLKTAFANPYSNIKPSCKPSHKHQDSLGSCISKNLHGSHLYMRFLGVRRRGGRSSGG